jgi:replicative DNA helicase
MKDNLPQRIKSNPDSFGIGGGKLPPQAIEFEEAVLGACMIEKGAVEKVIGIITAQDFYKDPHVIIFTAIVALFGASCPVDILTVTDQLRKTGQLDLIGGGGTIPDLTSRVASSANIEYHAFIIKQQSIKRNMIRICGQAINDAFDETTDALKLVEKVDSEISGIGIQDVSSGAIDTRSRMDATLLNIETGRNNNGVTGVPCGIVKVDRFTGGFQKSDLIFIGARPGNYKTALIMAFAHKMVPLGFTPFIAQQEMGEVQSGMRELAMYSGVDTQNMRRGLVSDEELVKIKKAAAEISALKVFIDHTGGLSLSGLKAKVKKQMKINKIDIVFVDYLQLLKLENRSKQDTEESMISQTTRKLKLMAKELKIPVVALSQLSREVEKRSNKRPILSDLKGSGAIEADADIVILLYNAAMYHADPVDEAGNSLKNKVELIFCKNRQGAVGSITLNVNPGTNTFNDDEYIISTHAPEYIGNLNGIGRNGKDDSIQGKMHDEDIPF